LGLFITFEGGEGCGKSYQAKLIYQKLLNMGVSTELAYEPGGTILGNEVRRLLKKKRDGTILPEAELFLFAACRFQLICEVIQPALQKGKVVICDRFVDSTVAYQGYGRGLDFVIINEVNKIATCGINPDITILLDISAEKGLSRKGNKNDRFEATGLYFHHNVRDGYLKLAASDPDRWVVIDAELSKREISKIIWDKVSKLIASRQDISKKWVKN
jgi:dTMP kinase